MRGFVKRVWWWMRGRVDPSGVRWEVDEQIRAHVEMDAERLRAGGLGEQEALREAERRFGDRDRVRAEMLAIAGSRGDRDWLWIESARRLFTQAVRSLTATPGPSMMVLATLAAAVGVTTLMATVGGTVLFGAGGVTDPGRVMSIYASYPSLPEGMREQPLHGSLVASVAELEGVDALAGFKAGHFNLTGRGTPRRLDGVLTTPRLFEVGGVHPLLGPGFDGVRTGEERVVVLSWRLWTEAFGGDPSVVGTAVVLNDEPYEITGVMAAGYAFPRGGDMPPSFHFPGQPDLWVPLVPPERGPSDIGMVARLTPGLTAPLFRPRLDGILEEMKQKYGRAVGFEFAVVEQREQAVGRVRPALLTLLSATGLVMLVAMANITGVGVARSEGRLRDLAVRSALGAGRRGAVAHLAAESLVLGAVAAGGGVGLASGLAALIRRTAPDGIPDIDLVRIGPDAVGLALLLSLAGAACLALGPAFGMARWRLAETLRGARTAGGTGTRRTGNAIIALELAATLVLVAGGVVLTRTVLNLLSVDPGFEAGRVLTAEITLPEATYPDVARAGAVQGAKASVPAAVPRFQRELIQRLEAQPEIDGAAFANPLPFSGTQEASVFWVDGMDPSAPPPYTEYTVVTEDYFRTMGVPLLQGREFDAGEDFDSEPVAIVSASLAAQFPSGKAVGDRIKLGGAERSPYPWLRVVGVVGDVKRSDLVSAARPEMYVHVSQGGYTVQSTSRLVVRPAGDRAPASIVSRVRSVLHEADADLPLDAVSPLSDLVASAASRARFTASLTVGFSVLALLITALGLYSVVSFGAHTRRKELAVRTALGATSTSVAMAVLAETLRATGVGIVLGLAGTIALSRTLQGLVYGVGPLDPFTLIAAAGVLCAIVFVAAQGPVRACLRLDPARILSRE